MVEEALLRISRPRAARKASAQFQPVTRDKIDWYAFVVAFKRVVLEGLEIAFIVGDVRRRGQSNWSSRSGAVAAPVVVGAVAFLIGGWLARIPREWLRFAVGLLLTAFGTFLGGGRRPRTMA